MPRALPHEPSWSPPRDIVDRYAIHHYQIGWTPHGPNRGFRYLASQDELKYQGYRVNSSWAHAQKRRTTELLRYPHFHAKALLTYTTREPSSFPQRSAARRRAAQTSDDARRTRSRSTRSHSRFLRIKEEVKEEVKEEDSEDSDDSHLGSHLPDEIRAARRIHWGKTVATSLKEIGGQSQSKMKGRWEQDEDEDQDEES